MNQWQTDYDKAAAGSREERAHRPEQLKAYKEFQDWQTEMRNSFQNRPGNFRARRWPGRRCRHWMPAIAAPFIAVAPAAAARRQVRRAGHEPDVLPAAGQLNIPIPESVIPTLRGTSGACHKGTPQKTAGIEGGLMHGAGV